MPPRRLPPRAALASHMDTPYRDILYSNIVPPDEEIPRIRHLVVAPMQEIQDLTDEIAGFRASIDQLIQQRDERVHKRDALTRRLPDDILREILTASLPSDRYPRLNRKDAPVLISHICRDWRRLALSMPRVWTSLHIAAPSASPWVSAETISQGVKTWLTRSAELPLSISYVRTTSVAKELKRDAEKRFAILHTLIKYSRRWSHMRFIFPLYEWFEPLAVLSPEDVPLLQTIIIHAGSFALNAEKFFGFTRGPSLHGLSFKSPFYFTSDIPSLVAPSQIRNLSLQGPIFPLSGALEMLRRSSSLKTCTLTIVDPSTIPTTLPPIRMDNMCRLGIIDSTWEVSTS
ncbi:hypothetical protein B0H19DRAFT_1386291 [Mycena capillaripes]|nr:hypothetical protein B0H19DRAFT_1386291 [Mycena capillaripes]